MLLFYLNVGIRETRFSRAAGRALLHSMNLRKKNEDESIKIMIIIIKFQVSLFED